MSWNAYAHLSGKNGGAYYHRVGLENLQNNLIGVVGGSVVGGGGKLAKSSSGSIEVQLSSNCSQLTAGQIYALIKESIGDTKGLSYHENDANDASALFLGRPDEVPLIHLFFFSSFPFVILYPFQFDNCLDYY